MMNVLERIKTFDFSKKLFFKLSPAIVKHGYCENSCMSDLNAEDELIKLAEIGERMQWVSVKDRLPEHEQEVIIYVKTENGYLVTGGLTWYSDVEKFIDGITVLRLNKSEVTHWMPLPNKPI